jgi:hypothetical protein
MEPPSSGKLDLESRLVSSAELTHKFSVSSGKVPAKLKRPKFRNTTYSIIASLRALQHYLSSRSHPVVAKSLLLNGIIRGMPGQNEKAPQDNRTMFAEHGGDKQAFFLNQI